MNYDDEIIKYLSVLDYEIQDIHISSKSITVLPDLSRFKKLRHLDISHNYLKNLNDLPKTLKSLSCDTFQISNYDNLPPDLEILYISPQNCIQTNNIILNNLPISLKYIKCWGSNLIHLDYLPISVTILDCNLNKLSKLDNLPIYLSKLNCFNNKISKLHNLPSFLQLLICYNNNIKKIYHPPKICIEKGSHIHELEKFTILKCFWLFVIFMAEPWRIYNYLINDSRMYCSDYDIFEDI